MNFRWPLMMTLHWRTPFIHSESCMNFRWPLMMTLHWSVKRMSLWSCIDCKTRIVHLGTSCPLPSWQRYHSIKSFKSEKPCLSLSFLCHNRTGNRLHTSDVLSLGAIFIIVAVIFWIGFFGPIWGALHFGESLPAEVSCFSKTASQSTKG